MASLDYGMYGFNVVNANGETTDLPICQLQSHGSGTLSQEVRFLSVTNDPYGMAVPNASGTLSTIRTLVSGYYEISYSVQVLGGAAPGTVGIQTYVDRTIYFSPVGNVISGAGSYRLDAGTVAFTNTAFYGYAANTVRCFLEKDCYVSLYATTINGTAPTLVASPDGFFSVRCVSTENYGKSVVQTT